MRDEWEREATIICIYYSVHECVCYVCITLDLSTCSEYEISRNKNGEKRNERTEYIHKTHEHIDEERVMRATRATGSSVSGCTNGECECECRVRAAHQREARPSELASIARQFERIKAEMHGKQIAIHNERFCCELPCGCEDKFKIIAIRRDDAPMSCAQLHSERSSSFALAHNRCKIHTFGFRISFIDIRVRAHTATKYQPARMCRWNCTQMGPSLWPIRL